MRELLGHATVKRWIICNLAITEQFAAGLRSCLGDLPVEFTRVEMLAVNLLHISPDVFHRMMGRTIVAQQVFHLYYNRLLTAVPLSTSSTACEMP